VDQLVHAALGAVEVAGWSTRGEAVPEGIEVVRGALGVDPGGDEVGEIAPGTALEGCSDHVPGLRVVAFLEVEPGGEGQDPRLLGLQQEELGKGPVGGFQVAGPQEVVQVVGAQGGEAGALAAGPGVVLLGAF
jgi:hypothetical protein